MEIVDALAKIRKDFPLIDNAKDVYLDNAATTQKPYSVLEATQDFYLSHNANVHRAAHSLSADATNLFEGSRLNVQQFINANSSNEVIWTRGTTESINIIAQCYAVSQLQPDDEILITHMEHHSNIVPWQFAASRTGAKIVAVNVTDNGLLDLDDFYQKLNNRTKIVSLAHISNATGVLNPVEEVIAASHDIGAIVVLDGAQAIAHEIVDVQQLDCDFYAFSGHKMYAPTGIGVLYGKSSLLEQMPPWQGGGEMIETVSIEKSTFNVLPYKFEAGTPNISGAIGLSAAIDYLATLDRAMLKQHEQSLLQVATSDLLQIDGIRIIGDTSQKTSIISFVMNGMHPQDVGTLLDQQSVAVRTGHHCTQPLMHHLGLPGTVRAS
ncbi:MAG: SufS family cysteine desulfurase, partial [Pseudomonadales bacterium]|nr:SufS family cysteine desulfurase [Pseudomonadales bacterium]